MQCTFLLKTKVVLVFRPPMTQMSITAESEQPNLDQHLVPSSAVVPMHLCCTLQWMIFNFRQDWCFHVLRSSINSVASSASYSLLHHFYIYRDSGPQVVRQTKAIMTTASICRSPLDNSQPYLGVNLGLIWKF